MADKSEDDEDQLDSLSHTSLHVRKRRTRWIIRLLIILLSVLLCLYQSYLVSVLYFRYPTNVDIRLDQSPFVHLPAVTVCSELASTILIEDLGRISPPIRRIFGGKTRPEINQLLSRTNVREQLLSVLQALPINQQHAYTISARNFFYECHLPTPINAGNRQPSDINCTQFAPILETINRKYKCFSLFMNRTSTTGRWSPPSYDIPKDVVTNFKYLIWMGINRDYIFNGFIYIHPPHLFHQFSNPKSVQHLDPNRHQSVTIAFEREVIRLLPPPYETNCRDYRTSGYQSREHCLTSCKVERYLQQDGWPGDVYAEANITSHFSRLWLNTYSRVGHLQEGLSASALAGCTEHCGSFDDCERIQFDSRTVRVTERSVDDFETLHRFDVGVLPPKEVQLVIRHVPKFAPIEFVIYIGGLLNLYLGFSAISLGVLILTYCTFSTKVQTKHVCLPVRKRKKATPTCTKSNGRNSNGKDKQKLTKSRIFSF